MANVCLTRKGAEAYIAANGHNLHSPRVYVASGYRNAEWKLLRELFIELFNGKASLTIQEETSTISQ